MLGALGFQIFDHNTLKSRANAGSGPWGLIPDARATVIDFLNIDEEKYELLANH
jgi:hypothetical protein